MYCHCVIAYSFEVQNNFTHRESTALFPKINIGSTMSYFFYKQSACLLKICICSGSVVECLTRDEGAQTRA